VAVLHSSPARSRGRVITRQGWLVPGLPPAPRYGLPRAWIGNDRSAMWISCWNSCITVKPKLNRGSETSRIAFREPRHRVHGL